jgi:hypothetical protein
VFFSIKTMVVGKLFVACVAALLLLFAPKNTTGASTCTLSYAGVEQVAGTLTTLTTDVTNLQAAITALTTTVNTLATQTSLTAVATAVTAIGVTTVNTETTVNTIASELVVNVDQINFLAAVTPIAYSPQAAGYLGQVFGWTSGTVLPWSGGEFLTTTFCPLNGGNTWLLDAAANTAVTIASFPQILTSIVGSLPTAASYNFLVIYNDACPGPAFSYGAITGTCCTLSTNHDYIYNTATGAFTCSDQTTPAFPLCAATPTGADVRRRARNLL